MSDMCRDYPSDDQWVTDRQMLLLTCNQEWQYTEWTFSHIINAIVTTVTVVTIQSQRTESETYGEVSLEHLWSTVRVIATDLTSIADVEAVQFVQPVRYWLHTNTHSTQHRYTHTYIHTVHSSDIFITSNVTSRHRGPKWKLRAGYRALSLQCTYYLCVALLCCELYIFHHRVWYSPRHSCIQTLGIVLNPLFTFVPNFVSVVASTAELALGEKAHTQSPSHSLAYLMPREPKWVILIICEFVRHAMSS